MDVVAQVVKRLMKFCVKNNFLPIQVLSTGMGLQFGERFMKKGH